MRNILYSGVLAAGLLLPAMASAQTAPASDQAVVLRPGQLLSIGAGVIVGALVAEIAVPTRLGLVAGAVIGGYLGDFWYTGSQLEVHVTTPKA